MCGSQADGMDGRRAIFFESNNASGNAQTANSKTINFSRPTGIERSGDEERESASGGSCNRDGPTCLTTSAPFIRFHSDSDE